MPYLIFSNYSTLIKKEPKPVPGGASEALLGWIFQPRFYLPSAQSYTEIVRPI